MSPWVRVLGAFAAVVVGALLLKVLPPILVLAMLIGGLAYVNYKWKPVSPRKQVAETSAQVLGLEHASVDRFGLAGYPFALLRRAADPEISNIVWGTWRGRDVKAFELRLDLAMANEAGRSRRFACATAPATAMYPPIVIEPAAFLLPPNEAAPSTSVSTGDRAFDERFSVRCGDGGFARDALDEDLRGWMMSAGEGWGFELSAGVALAYQPVDAWAGATEAIEAVTGLVDRIPSSVRERFALPTADSPPLPARPDLP